MSEEVNFNIELQSEPTIDIVLKDGSSSGTVELPMIPRTFFPAMEAGYISEDDGSDVESISFFRSVNSTPYRQWASVYFPTGYSGKLYLYDSESYTGNTENWSSGTVTVPPLCSHYRIVAKNESIDDFSGIDNNAISITDYDTIQNRFNLVFDALITRIE